MRKLKCRFGHLTLKVKDCRKEKYENDDEAIAVYYCKYCGKAVLVRTLYVKAQFKDAFERQ